MTNYQVTWKPAAKISQNDDSYPCRQVYVWLMTKDQQVVIVSKDGDNWQLPGGKPEAGEAIYQTAVREVFEETGLDVSSAIDQIKMFGYYLVVDTKEADTYLQVRCQLRLSQLADQLSLSVDSEDKSQSTEDVISHVKLVPLQKITDFIPWMLDSGEYRYLFK